MTLIPILERLFIRDLIRRGEGRKIESLYGFVRWTLLDHFSKALTHLTATRIARLDLLLWSGIAQQMPARLALAGCLR